MNKHDLEQLAKKELSLDLSLTEAYIRGARMMQQRCYKEAQDLSYDLMTAQESDDWQEVAHVALDVIPRLFNH